MLADFIEQEKPDEIVDWQHDELHSNVWSELTQLYRWWKEERPNRHDPLDDVPSPPEEEYVFTEEGQLIFPDREKYPEYYAAMEKPESRKRVVRGRPKATAPLDRRAAIFVDIGIVANAFYCHRSYFGCSFSGPQLL